MALQPWTKSANTPSFRLWIKQATHTFIMKTRTHTQTKSTLAALAGLALAAGAAHAATPITILNAGFENSSTSIGNGNNTDIADWTEDTGNAFVDTGGGWVPSGSDMLYIGSAAVNQDLSHNWSASDSFTLDMIAMNPAWSGGAAGVRVQLRQASDDAVLWDSGLVDVSGTVVAGPAYSGTGHELSWNIDASTFVTGSAGEQINVRIAAEAGTVYADNVSLSFDTVPEPTTTALLGLGGLALILRRRK